MLGSALESIDKSRTRTKWRVWITDGLTEVHVDDIGELDIGGVPAAGVHTTVHEGFGAIGTTVVTGGTGWIDGAATPAEVDHTSARSATSAIPTTAATSAASAVSVSAATASTVTTASVGSRGRWSRRWGRRWGRLGGVAAFGLAAATEGSAGAGPVGSFNRGYDRSGLAADGGYVTSIIAHGDML